MEIEALLTRVSEYLPPERTGVIEDAYRFAEKAHNGTMRLSGEPYIQHPLNAAYTVAGLQLDAAAVAAALLHDVMEDCGVGPDEMRPHFGPEITRLVEGTTKLSKMHWQPREGGPASATQAENLRKMSLAMAEDVRV